jgi:pantothenate kinase type III
VALPREPPPELAFSTEAAIQAGVIGITLEGLHALVRRWCDRQRAAGEVPCAVATGGDSEAALRWRPALCERRDPDLVLWGIRTVADRTSQ